MKKFAAVLLAIGMCFALVACGGGGNDTESSKSQKTQEPKVENKYEDIDPVGFIVNGYLDMSLADLRGAQNWYLDNVDESGKGSLGLKTRYFNENAHFTIGIEDFNPTSASYMFFPEAGSKTDVKLYMRIRAAISAHLGTPETCDATNDDLSFITSDEIEGVITGGGKVFESWSSSDVIHAISICGPDGDMAFLFSEE